MQLLQGTKKGVRCLAFSPAGDTLAAGYYDATIRLWELATGVGRRMAGIGATPKFLAWTLDGRRIASAIGSIGQGSAFWCSTDGEKTDIAASAPEVGTGCLSPDGHTFYLPVRGGIRRWDTRSGAELAAWPAWSPGHLAASSDGAWVASTHPQFGPAKEDVHHVAVRDARTGAVASRIEDRAEFCDGVAFAPDGRRLAVAKHQSLWVWEWPGCRVVCTHRTKKFFTGLAYAPDGRVLATSGNDGFVRFWGGADGQPLAAFDWQIDKVLCVAFAPDGLRAAAGGASGNIVVWDVE